LALRPSCFRNFLKNTGHFQPCPPFVLKTFSKTQGGFRAARWMLFVAGRFRLSADSVSAIRFDYFEPQTPNRFPFNWRHKPFLRYGTKRMFCGQEFFVSQNQKRIFSVLRCLGIFRVVTFQSKTGRFVARNFSRTRGKFDLRREATQGACPAPPAPPREKKTTAPPPARQNTGSFTKTLEFQRHFRRYFHENTGQFQPRPPETYLSCW